MTDRLYERIYEVVQHVPPGKVTTYGQVANVVGECSARMVGYALAALKPGSDVPWHRVINSKGKISLRNDGFEYEMQRHLLESEGVQFNGNGTIDLEKFGWSGLDVKLLVKKGFYGGEGI